MSLTHLAKVPLELGQHPWNNGVLWNQNTGRMAETKNAPLATNLLLHIIGEDLNPANFALLDEFRRVLGDNTIRLPKRA